MFNLNEIKQRALSQSYQLGTELYLAGKVRGLSVAGNTVTAIVAGQHDYHVTLMQGKSIAEPIQVSCSCPAAAYQDICKHAVAVAQLVENTPVAKRVNEADNHAQLVVKRFGCPSFLAPLSGFTDHENARLWDRFGMMIYKNGKRFYNFEGLRNFKNKFDPEWVPRYMATTQKGVTPFLTLVDIAALTSGGLKGVFKKEKV